MVGDFNGSAVGRDLGTPGQKISGGPSPLCSCKGLETISKECQGTLCHCQRPHPSGAGRIGEARPQNLDAHEIGGAAVKAADRTGLRLGMRRGFVKKEGLGCQQHLLDPLGEGWEAGIVQYCGIHRLFREFYRVHIHHLPHGYAACVPIRNLGGFRVKTGVLSRKRRADAHSLRSCVQRLRGLSMGVDRAEEEDGGNIQAERYRHPPFKKPP